MIKSFNEYLIEERNVAYFTFGRMNPPTAGHEKLLDNLSAKSGKNPYFIFLSQSQDPKKNPLDYSSKVKHVRKMFPRHARRVMINRKVRTVFDAASYLYEQGHRKIAMVVGSDRVREFETLLNKYNGKKGQHGFYNFKDIQIISAGARDPDAEGVEGMSASKLRAFAADNDFASFSQGLGRNMNTKDSKKLFTDVRKGMGIKEETVFKRHVELEPVSETRERFVKGELFSVGDQVVIKESEEIGTVTVLGSNYVVVEVQEGKSLRKWLDAVEKLDESCGGGMDVGGVDVPEPEVDVSRKKRKTSRKAKDDEVVEKKVAQDPDIKDREGTQPAKYHRGLSKAMKTRRDRQFKKQAKMSDSDPKAYKPAPGDADAKTKKSTYTKQFKQMYGEAK